MPASLTSFSSNFDMAKQRSAPSLPLAKRTASWNCWYVQEPIPAVIDIVMFGPWLPCPSAAWQGAHWEA